MTTSSAGSAGSTATSGGSVDLPSSYLHASYPREEMAALYRAADVMVVTPFADGMNLVAKEYVTCRLGNDGALVLSEFAGASDELKQAYLVNPHDINGVRDAMLAAMHAPAREKSRRMRAMRKQVREHDIDTWATGFLDDLGAPTARDRRRPAMSEPVEGSPPSRREPRPSVRRKFTDTTGVVHEPGAPVRYCADQIRSP